jgi:hypothetical protein
LKASLARGYDDKDRYRKSFPRRRDGSRITIVKLHQPTLKTLDVLDEGLCSFHVIRVDVALDLWVASSAEAEYLGQYIARRFLIRHSKTTTPIQIERRDGRNGDRLGADVALDDAERDLPPTTLYFDREVGDEGLLRKRGKEGVIYWDRDTKVRKGPPMGDMPCVHLELRFLGAAALRKVQLNTTAGMRLRNYQDLWSTQIRMLVAPDAERLAKWLSRTSDATRPGDLPSASRRTADHLLRASSLGESTEGATHNLLHLLRKPAHRRRNAFRLFREEPLKWLLPGEVNALWALNL